MRNRSLQLCQLGSKIASKIALILHSFVLLGTSDWKRMLLMEKCRRQSLLERLNVQVYCPADMNMMATAFYANFGNAVAHRQLDA